LRSPSTLFWAKAKDAQIKRITRSDRKTFVLMRIIRIPPE
jgi:hypothetical protein